MTSRTYRFTLADGDGVGHIPVPFDPKAVFGKARAPVVVAVNGHRFRSTIMTMGGVTFVPFRASNRTAAGVTAGDDVEVTLTLDTAAREVEVPPDLVAALDATSARARWDLLSYTQRREDAEAVIGAQKPETRAKRIAGIVARLG